MYGIETARDEKSASKRYLNQIKLSEINQPMNDTQDEISSLIFLAIILLAGILS